MSSSRRVLVIGYGNPGRLDDGLGPAFVAALEGRVPEDVTLDADYQLAVEDAAAVADHDEVVFVDAAIRGAEPFFFERVQPGESGSAFTSHGVEAPEVVALARDVFGSSTRAWALGIRGYEFDAFGERLSERAQANLQEALLFFEGILEGRDFEYAETAFKERAAERGPFGEARP